MADHDLGEQSREYGMPAFEVRGYAICIGHHGLFGPPSPGSQGGSGVSKPRRASGIILSYAA